MLRWQWDRVVCVQALSRYFIYPYPSLFHDIWELHDRADTSPETAAILRRFWDRGVRLVATHPEAGLFPACSLKCFPGRRGAPTEAFMRKVLAALTILTAVAVLPGSAHAQPTDSTTATQTNLQRFLQVYEQLLQEISNIMKSFADETKSVISNIK
jgi:hypothetical protein